LKNPLKKAFRRDIAAFPANAESASNARLAPAPAMGGVPLPLYLHQRQKAGWRRRSALAWFALLITAFFYGALFALFPPAFVPPMLLPLAIGSLLIIWALPTTDRPPVRSLSFLFTSFFVALLAWPTYLAIAIPGLPWISFIRIFGFPLLLALLVSISVSPTFRKELKHVLLSSPLVFKLLCLLLVCQLVSTLFSAKPYISFQKFVINQAYWTSVFLCACYLFRSRERIVAWALQFSALALFISAIGFWEWRIGHVPWAGHIPALFKIEDETVARILAGSARAATGIYRVQSTATTSLSLAEVLALATPFLIYLTLESRRIIWKAAAVLLLPFVLFTIINTNARLGALGFLLSFLLYLGFWGVRRWRSVRGSVMGPAITLAFPAIFVMFFVATMLIGRLQRLVWGGGEHQFSTDSRIAQVEMGLPMVLRKPLGHGGGQAAEVLGFTDLNGLLTIDNYLLSILLEYGVVGFIAYFGMFVAAIIYGIRFLIAGSKTDDADSIAIPVVVSLMVFLVIKTVLSQEANHPIAFMLLGMICAIVAGPSEGQDRCQDVNSRRSGPGYLRPRIRQPRPL
jgi:hypothetical protein